MGVGLGVCIGSHFVGGLLWKKEAIIIVHDFASPQAKMVATSYILDHKLSSHPASHAHGVVVARDRHQPNVAIMGVLIPRRRLEVACHLVVQLGVRCLRTESSVSTHLTKLLFFLLAMWPSLSFLRRTCADHGHLSTIMNLWYLIKLKYYVVFASTVDTPSDGTTTLYYAQWSFKRNFIKYYAQWSMH